MNPVAATSVVASKATDSRVVEAHGARIPLIGLGTWNLRGSTCVRMVEQALRLGYRHVDTAEMYDNEREVGEGLRASGLARDQAFITTKIWPSHFAPRELERAVKESLARLQLAEVDLLLLHWPNPQIPLRETLGALCKVKADGTCASYRGFEFHRRPDRRSGAAGRRAADIQSDRGASVHRPVEGHRVLPAAGHGDRRLQSRGTRWGQERQAARTHCQGARQERGSGEPALPGAAGDCCHSAHQPGRAPVGKSHNLRLRAVGGGDGGDCAAGAARWAYRRLCLFGIAQLGLIAG